MYKDKDKQKQAAREAKTRWKAKQGDKLVREALGIPVEGIPEQGIPPLDESIPPDLELCRYCSAPLPKLLKPRRWPGACYPCSLTNAGRVKTIDDKAQAVIPVKSDWHTPKGRAICQDLLSQLESTVIWESEPGAAEAITNRLK